MGARGSSCSQPVWRCPPRRTSEGDRNRTSGSRSLCASSQLQRPITKGSRPLPQARQGSLRAPPGICWVVTHLPSSSVVVKVHQRSRVFSFPFLGVHEGSGKFNAVVNVIAAATPVEVALGVLGRAFLLGIAGAGFQLPLAACPGDGKNNSSGGDGVYKSRFPTT